MNTFDDLVSKYPTKTACHHCSFQNLDKLSMAVGKEIACALRRVTLPADSTTPHIAIMVSHGLGLVAAILGTLKVGAIPLVIIDENDPRTSCLDEYVQILLADTMHIESLLARGINVPPTLVLNTAVLTTQGVSGVVLRKSIHFPSFDGYDKMALYQKRITLVTHDALHDCLVQHQDHICLRCDAEGQPKGIEKDVIPLWRIHEEVDGWHDEPKVLQQTTETHIESDSSHNLHPSSNHHPHPHSRPTHHAPTSSSTVVQQHICQLIQHIKGRRPPPSASFSGIGNTRNSDLFLPLTFLTH